MMIKVTAYKYCNVSQLMVVPTLPWSDKNDILAGKVIEMVGNVTIR